MKGAAIGPAKATLTASAAAVSEILVFMVGLRGCSNPLGRVCVGIERTEGIRRAWRKVSPGRPENALGAKTQGRAAAPFWAENTLEDPPRSGRRPCISLRPKA